MGSGNNDLSERNHNDHTASPLKLPVCAGATPRKAQGDLCEDGKENIFSNTKDSSPDPLKNSGVPLVLTASPPSVPRSRRPMLRRGTFLEGADHLYSARRSLEQQFMSPRTQPPATSLSARKRDASKESSTVSTRSSSKASTARQHTSRESSVSREPSVARRRRASTSSRSSTSSSRKRSLSKARCEEKLNDRDRHFLRALFVTYSHEFKDGEPIMAAEGVQALLRDFIGHHQDVINDSIEQVANTSPSDEGSEFRHPGLSLEVFGDIVNTIEKNMQPGALKKIVTTRKDACAGDANLLAGALKTINTLPPLSLSSLCETTRWKP